MTDLLFGDEAFGLGTFGGLGLPAGPISGVAYAVEVAFGVNPYTDPVPTDWVDITAYVRDVSTRRGRNHELGKTSAGVATLTLNNRDRRFDPTNTSSPYYPNVRPMQHIRIRATYALVPYNLFRGFVEDWGQQWSGPAANAKGDATCEVSCVDAFKLLEMIELGTNYSEAVLTDSPMFYFPLTDLAGTLETPNLGSTDAHVVSSPAGPGHVAFGRSTVAPFPYTWETAVDFSDPTGVGGGVPAQGLIIGTQPDKADLYGFGFLDMTTARTISVEAWVLSDNGGLGVHEGYYFDLEDLGLPGDPMFEIGQGIDGVMEIRWRQAGPSTRTYESLSQFWTNSNQWHHVVVTMGLGVLSIYKDGALFDRSDQGEHRPVASYTPAPPGYIGVGSNPTFFDVRGWDGAVAHLAVYDHVLNPEQVAAHHAAGLDTFTAQTPGFVLNTLLDGIAWPAGQRNIGTGVSTVTLTVDGSALDTFQLVAEDTEHGIFEVAVDGKITFIPRDAFSQASLATFGDGGGSEIPYRDLALAYDDQDLWTEVDVSGATGSTSATDAGAVASYGQRNLGVTTVAATDAELTAQATGLLNRYKQPAVRPVSVTFMGPRSITQQLQRAVGDRVTLKRRPPGGGTITVDAIIEGVNHDVGPNGWLTTSFALAPPDPVTGTYWVLDDAVFSVLDTTTIPGW